MVANNTGLSRRDVLRSGAAAGALAVGGTGLAAGDDTVEVNVGYARESGRRAARNEADEVRREFNFGALTIRTSEEAAERLENRGDVRYVEENGRMHALEQTLPWGIDRVDADVAHDDGETGEGAAVAILDTGIDSDHYDLADNIGGGACFADECCGEATGGIFGCDDNDNECHHEWDDDNDHGTHCAGTADAIDDTEGVVGVSTEATLYAGKVLNGCGSGSYDAIAAGIEWAADQGHDVASMSLGGDDSSVVKDACVYAYDRGVLLVAAAGNDGPCSDCVGYPAAYEEVVAVSATSEDDSLADFSSTGPEVELAAPGEGVLSTVPPESSADGLDTFSGTSMACPHVSGAGGQLMANGYTNTEARQRLQDTAEDLGLGDNEQGHGLLDAEAAVLDGSDGGGDGDAAPTVSWVNPSDGETVSGTVTVQIDASDSEDSDDSLDVTYAVDGGSERSTTYDSTSGYYEDEWDSTGVEDGDHTLEANATDSAGNTSTATITITTDNTEDASSAPTIDSFALTDASNPRWAKVEVDWAVSDADGDLAEVTTEVVDWNDSIASGVGGSSASGTHEHRERDGHGTVDVTLTVTDSGGNEASETKSITLE